MKENSVQELAQLIVKMVNFFVMVLSTIPTQSIKDARDKTCVTLKLKTRMVYTALPIPPLTYALKLAHPMKFYAILLKDLLDARAHTSVKPDPRMTWINIAPAQLIALFTAKPTNTTAQPERMNMDANCPMNVLRRNEDLMESFVPSIAQKNVMKSSFSVPEALMKLGAKQLTNAEIKKSTNGDLVLKPSLNPNAPDTVRLNVLLMKSSVHHN